MKKLFKYLVAFILSILVIFYDFDNLNILLAIPLFTFLMFNGLPNMLISFLGLTVGSLFYYFINGTYLNSIYLLIALCIYFLIYHLSLLIHSKLIINYLTSNIISLIISYLIYVLTNGIFNLYNLTLFILLSCLISLLFAYLLKNFSFYLLTFSNDSSKVLLVSLLLMNVSLIAKIANNKLFLYFTLGSILIILFIYALRSNILEVLALNSALIILGFFFKIDLLYNYLYLTLPLSVALAFNNQSLKYLNCLLVLALYIIIYFLKDISDFNYYMTLALLTSLSVLLINNKKPKIAKDYYYQLYVNNKNEMLKQFASFENLFRTLGSNFHKEMINDLLEKVQVDVFSLWCKNCPKATKCFQKGQHLLINYLKNTLYNKQTFDSLRYLKNNCEKQDSYFILLDKFVNNLISNYQKETSNIVKDIIANHFESFASIMNQYYKAFNNDKLILSNNFYKNLKELLADYQYDVLFVNNLSNDKQYQFNLGLKDISVVDIKEFLMPLISETLQTNMEIASLDIATLSANYFILTIKEKEKLKVSYAIKQSNEDIKANGDSITTLNNNNLFFLAISDGMGHGITANDESKFTLDTLMAMLKTNMDIKTSINLANELIKLKKDNETYTTLDLLAIDLQRNIASFYKLGAFNAYIIRNHQVTEVNNYSLPLGIVTNLNPLASSFIIEKGDIIVMCSDGMIDDTNSNVLAILEDLTMDLPQTLCNVLFSQLITVRQNNDDATLAIVTIN